MLPDMAFGKALRACRRFFSDTRGPDKGDHRGLKAIFTPS